MDLRDENGQLLPEQLTNYYFGFSYEDHDGTGQYMYMTVTRFKFNPYDTITFRLKTTYPNNSLNIECTDTSMCMIKLIGIMGECL